MPSDISRLTFDKNKNYSGVRMQQGRVLLDADWNEQLDIQQHRRHTQTVDVVGRSGVPKSDDSFLVKNAELEINAGRIYINGLLCELDAPTDYLNQPYYPNPNQQYFEALNEDEPAQLKVGSYLVYVEAWQREINYVDDPAILEVALGGIDTTTRLQTVWQIKLLEIEAEADIDAIWKNHIEFTLGKLQAQLSEDADRQKLENQLYRVEIHQGGDQDNATFKWSRENASIEIKIVKIANDVLTVKDTDRLQDFDVNDWVEIIDAEANLNRVARELVQIKNINFAKQEIVLQNPPSLIIEEGTEPQLKLRRWDQRKDTGANGLKLSEEWIKLENGIQVQFSADNYRTGDYWLIPSRHITESIEWEKEADGSPMAKFPHGKQYHYAKLALATVETDNFSVEDLRSTFPSLTNIEATDIKYDNSAWQQTEAETVQEALDELCQQEVKRACTYVVFPRLGWEEVFDRIGEGVDAQICFQVGTYPLTAAVTLKSKGHLKLTGCGFGSRIAAEELESCLIFESCESVTIRDLSIESQLTAAAENTSTGTLVFKDCVDIDINNVTVKRKWNIIPNNCIHVQNSTNSGVVKIQNSKLIAGYLQSGIFIDSVKEVLIENNSLLVSNDPIPSELFKNEILLEELSSIIISDIIRTEDIGDEGVNRTQMKLEILNSSVYFKTAIGRGTWETLLETYPPEEREYHHENPDGYFYPLVRQLLNNKDEREKFPEFEHFSNNFISEYLKLGSSGMQINILETDNNVRILNNYLNSFITSITILPKNANGRGNVSILNNSIKVSLPPFLSKALTIVTPPTVVTAYECKSLIFENNSIFLQRLSGQFSRIDSQNRKYSDIYITGINVYGGSGSRVLLSQNLIDRVSQGDGVSFNEAMNLTLYSSSAFPDLWAVTWNIASGINSNINASSAGSPIRVENNVPR